MEEILKYSDFGVEVSAPEVMQLLGCSPDNALYEEMMEEYEEIREELTSLGNPQALIYFGEMSGSIATKEVPEGAPVVYLLVTEGREISRYSTRMFEEGDYVKGMIADAFSGNYLFELEKQVLKILRMECAKRGVGILARMEAPVNLPMEAQKVIFDTCRAKEELGMDITCGYMFDPVKTSALIFKLSEDPDVFKAQHDCSKCAMKNCVMRKA